MAKGNGKNDNNKKGFTLLEFLIVVFILGIVAVVGFDSYFSIMNNAKNKSLKVALNNIKNAALQYSKEENSVNWFKAASEDEAYACVTVSDLINFGYFKSNFLDSDLYKNSDISLNSYFYIVKNLKNAVSDITQINDFNIDSEEKCQNYVTNEFNDTSFEVESSFYTDAIVFQGSDLEDDNLSYKCAVRKKNSDWLVFDAKNNICDTSEIGGLEGVPNYTDVYEGRLCLSNVDNCLKESESTGIYKFFNNLSDFVAPSISFDPSVDNYVSYRDVIIRYDNTNIKDGNGYHYFKADSNGILDNTYDLYLCKNITDINSVNNSNCTEKVVGNILKGNIYMLNGSEITFRIKDDILDNKSKIYATIKDKTGNYKSVDKVIPKINTAVPQCEIVLTGTVGNNGYYRSKVNVKLNTGVKNGITAVDYGLATSKKPTNKTTNISVTSNTNSTIYYGYVKYSNGTESTCKKTVKVDKTSPTCSLNSKKNSNSGGTYTSGTWYDGDVYTSANCSDSESGCDSKKTVTTTGVTANVTDKVLSSLLVKASGTSKVAWTVYDKAGNSKNCTAVTTKIDKVAPTCNFSSKKDSSSGGTYTSGTWYNGDVYTSATCSDSLSGCASKKTVTTTGVTTNVTDKVLSSLSVKASGTSKVIWKVYDNVGNSKNCTAVTTKIDKVAPTCTSVSKKNSNSGGTYTSGTWYDGNVYTNATCSDTLSGCASKKTVTTTGATTNVTEKEFSSWLVKANGTSKVAWTIYDNVGNSKKCTAITTKIDKAAPTCSFTVKKYADSDYKTSKGNYTSDTWYSGWVKSTASCEDTDGSGCNVYLTVTGTSRNVSDKKTSERNIAAQGKSTIKWVAKDNVGHTKNCDKIIVLLDRHKPTCTSKKSNTGTQSGVSATFTCSDKVEGVKVSGVKACTDTKTGLKANKSYTIKDNAGNEGTCKVSVSSYVLKRYLQTYAKANTCTKSCCGTETSCTESCNTQYEYHTSESTCRAKSGFNWWSSATGTCAYASCRNSCSTYNRSCTSASCCGTTTLCGGRSGSWGGSNTGCGSQSGTFINSICLCILK